MIIISQLFPMKGNWQWIPQNTCSSAASSEFRWKRPSSQKKKKKQKWGRCIFQTMSACQFSGSNFFQLQINHFINSSLMSPTELSEAGSSRSCSCGAVRIKFLLCTAVMSWALTPGSPWSSFTKASFFAHSNYSAIKAHYIRFLILRVISLLALMSSPWSNLYWLPLTPCWCSSPQVLFLPA